MVESKRMEKRDAIQTLKERFYYNNFCQVDFKVKSILEGYFITIKGQFTRKI